MDHFISLFVLTFVFVGLEAVCPDACTCEDGETRVICDQDQQAKLPDELPDSMTELVLRNFDLPFIDSDFFVNVSVSSLESVLITDANIVDVHADTFKEFSSLRRLDLSSNKIFLFTFLKQTIMESLIYLKISSQDVENFENSIQEDHFSSLKKLEVIKLDSLVLKEFPTNILKYMNLLEEIHLDNNKIKSVNLEQFRSVKCIPFLLRYLLTPLY